MDVEALAVSKISNMIARCPHLQAYISTNDKTPFTDGYIDLYQGLRRAKEDWKGRVPVQVKGRTRAAKKGTGQNHGISRTELLAFQNDSGVLYFVVAIDPKTSHETPYYALLSPFTIQAILDKVPETQQQVSVPLKKLLNDTSAIEGVVALALKTRAQSMETGFDPILFENLQSLTIHTTDDLNFNGPVILNPGSSDFALVLNTKSGLSVPLNGEFHIVPQQYLKRDVDLTVSSGNISYDSASIRLISEETMELSLSPGLTLRLPTEPKEQSGQLSLTLEDSLVERQRAIKFYLALLETGVIKFDGRPSPFVVVLNDETAELREHVKTLDALVDLFEHLGVDLQLIDVSRIDETQTRQLNVLHRAFVLDEEIEDAATERSRVIQQVGPWELMFLVEPGEKTGKWRIIDPFAVEEQHQFRWSADKQGEEETIPVTKYDIVTQEHLGLVLNMRLDMIVSAYEAIKDIPSTFALANQRVLALVTAADEYDSRKTELLQAAQRLNDWLIAEEGAESRHLINGWQITRRSGMLTTDQRRGIRAHRRDVARKDIENLGQTDLACAILLGDYEEVKELADSLSVEQLEQMKSWPIWKLFHDLAGRSNIAITAP